ncbi:hypothetical protein ACH4E7_17850 [Kitasatospora sp. NPDC018058]|uniref:hypothetical protein n=1 Tax=Kitasatospora sp. NPDC018058 TaxID=3364025 RepID=UPI0037BFA250
MSAPRPRIHWGVDLLLALTVLLSIGGAAYIGFWAAFVLALFLHSWAAGLVVCVVGTLVGLAFTVRGTWRTGYRITPVVAAAAPVLGPLLIWPAVGLNILG